ncbi:MAG: tqsA 2 [Firmicutes bacterium]|nr:tqsA 2 [Bacillota bacterium]
MNMFSRVQIRWGIVIFIFIITAYFIWLVRSSLYPFILALFIAYLLNPLVNYVVYKGNLKRDWAIVWVYLVIFCAIILGGSLFVPLLIREFEGFIGDLPTITAKGEGLIQYVQLTYQNYVLPQSVRTALDSGLVSLGTDVQQLANDAVAAVVVILTHIVGLVISPILAFYLLHDWEELAVQVRCLLPGRWRTEVCAMLSDIDEVLSGIIRGQMTIAIIVGILVSSGLYILGVRYALIIGILAGILDVIPYFGAVIGGLPAVTVALLESPLLAAKTTALLFVIHQLEGTIIGPKILGETTGLNPLSVILVLFIGETLAGLMGMLFAVPVLAVSKVVFRHLIKALI